METTKLSSKGQIVLPKAIRQSRRWPPGTEFLVESTPRGILLRPRKAFGSTEPAEVFGRLKAGGGARTVKEMATTTQPRAHGRERW
ncbi:MAG: AbrB/MazE/SpoVT family DNA-binding domain-containing protein [Gammaproteobacteria bacterium]|nr:MAG: AbrB/MazE/SpoVT family DNA-binding domain-containing protein [Gammaproteobacteria bacterium]